MDEITLANGALRVDISPLGAEMRRIVDARGEDRLWSGDPAFWTGRAPVLFPVAGALKGDAYRLDGKEYALEKHGFARKRVFAPEARDGRSATFLLAGGAGRHPGFPFEYAFRARYTLEGPSIQVEYITENLGGSPFWYGAGAHEAYALPGGIAAYELAFERPETLVRGVLRGSLLTRETRVMGASVSVLPLDPRLLTETLVLPALASRSVTLRPRSRSGAGSPPGKSVRVDFPSFPYLLLWTVPGAPYLCVEPWTNLPDYVDTDQDVAKKPGMLRLNPGERRTVTHAITFLEETP